MTKKELGLLKGAIRRVFSRSDLRRAALALARDLHYTDPTRPRVKKWSICKDCKKHIPEYLVQVDHEHPIVPVDSALDLMSVNDLVNNTWCDIIYLNVLCKPCHSVRTKAQNKMRRENKKKREIRKKDE